MNVSVRAILANTKDSDQSSMEPETPPLPTFMNEPICPEPKLLKRFQSSKALRSAARVGGLTLGIFAAIVIVFGKMTSETIPDVTGEITQSNTSDHNSGSVLGSALGQAFAADFNTNNPGNAVVPMAIYPETKTVSQNDQKRAPMTAEELKQKVRDLQQEMKAMEQQGYDVGGEIDFSQTVATGDNAASLTVADSENMSDVQSPASDSIANPQWEEPLTPPRWGEEYSQDINREGVVIPLNRPEQTAWLTTPQWKRTDQHIDYNQDNDTAYSASLNSQQSGHFRIQLGSFRSAGLARSGWQQLLSQNSDILGVLDHSVEEADLGSRGVYYRVQAGSFANAGVAKVICDEVKARNADCLVVRR